MESSANTNTEILNQLSPQDREVFARTCGDLLVLYGAEKLRAHLLKEKLSTQDMLGIVTFLRDTAYGKPTSAVAVQPMQIEFNPIVVNQALADQAEENDRNAGII